MIGQACVCHLPTMILMKMRIRHQFYHQLHNRWWNRMVQISDSDFYPELIANQAWYGKICDTLGEWYLNPGTRMQMMLKWDPFIKEAMCYKPVDHSVHPERSIVLNGIAVDEFSDPMTTIARHALNTAFKYKEQNDSKKYLKLAI